MYQHVLIALENSPTDEAILNHIRSLIALTRAKIVLIHVADGFVARNQERFNLEDSEEIRKDREYLEEVRAKLEKDGFVVETVLARGDPPSQIVECARQTGCDLIAMSTHGHRFFGDLILGSVSTAVRHMTDIPVLLVPGRRRK